MRPHAGHRALAVCTSRLGAPPRGPKLSRLSAALSATVQLAGARGGLVVDVLWSDDENMLRLNRQHTGQGAVTDVLAFVQDLLDPENGRRRVGEVVCNLDLASRSARENGNGFEAEAILYATHGLAHLLGGDDHTPAGRRAMRRIERAALAAAGLEVRGGEWENRRTQRGGAR